jgi:hypothetical protein
MKKHCISFMRFVRATRRPERTTSQGHPHTMHFSTPIGHLCIKKQPTCSRDLILPALFNFFWGPFGDQVTHGLFGPQFDAIRANKTYELWNPKFGVTWKLFFESQWSRVWESAPFIWWIKIHGVYIRSKSIHLLIGVEHQHRRHVCVSVPRKLNKKGVDVWRMAIHEGGIQMAHPRGHSYAPLKTTSNAIVF